MVESIPCRKILRNEDIEMRASVFFLKKIMIFLYSDVKSHITRCRIAAIILLVCYKPCQLKGFLYIDSELIKAESKKNKMGYITLPFL